MNKETIKDWIKQAEARLDKYETENVNPYNPDCRIDETKGYIQALEDVLEAMEG